MDKISLIEAELISKLATKKQINHFLILEENNPIQKLIKTILLEEQIITIGRNEDNQIILSSPQISRYHAYLKRQEQGDNSYYEIIDGDLEGNSSQNGVFINQVELPKAILKHGDLIELGTETKLTYYLDYDGELTQQKSSIIARNNLVNDTIPEQNEPTIPFDTLYKNNYRLDELLKFSSIINLCPTPILEINLQGNITFINAVTQIHFPNLLAEKFNHPLLKNLLPYPESIKANLYKREINIDNKYYEQYVHNLPDLNVIRLYIFDVTSRQKQKQILKEKVAYDFTTGLPNYKYFLNNLHKTLANHQRNQRKFAVLIIDLENLYFIKENLTDKLEKDILREFAQRIKQCFREDDTVAYWRNNQFIILLSELDSFQDLGVICNRIFERTQIPFIDRQEQLYLNTNIGISVYPYDANNKEDLIRKADQALTSSKQDGANNYALFSHKINFEIKQYSRTLKNLQTALDNQEFTVYYQPIIHNQTQEIFALEALIRWYNPRHGLIYPQEFLDLAEKINLIGDITLWMLETIFQQRNNWQNSQFNNLPITINLSTKLFGNPLICSKIIDSIISNHQESQSLIIEITESAFLHDLTIKKALKKLLNLGIKIALDDFGSNNSSFNIIKKFPFHFLKIDQEFTKNIKNNPQDKAIISAINTIAKGFNMKVIAEGIENQEQWQIIQELGCEYSQGYLFSAPLPSDKIQLFFNNFLSINHQ